MSEILKEDVEVVQQTVKELAASLVAELHGQDADAIMVAVLELKDEIQRIENDVFSYISGEGED